MVILLSGAFSTALASVQCSEVPDSFEEWRLLNIAEDEEKVVRWFQHPSDTLCRGTSLSLQLDCKEYPVIRSVFTLGEKNEAVNPHTLFRMEDNQWKPGRGVNTIFAWDLGSGKRVAIFALDGGEPLTREIQLGEPCVK